MPVLCVVAALVALVVAGAAVYRLRQLRRALVAERAEARIAGQMQTRDLDAFRDRLNRLVWERAVLTEAEHVLDHALASYNPEGGAS